MKNLFIVIALLISYSTFCQKLKDLVVPTRGDSIRCRIDSINETNTYFTFKKKGNIISTSLKNSDISSFQYQSFDSKRKKTNWIGVGFNLSSVDVEVKENITPDVDPIPGFIGGWSNEQPVNERFSLEKGIFLTAKGFSSKSAEDGIKADALTRIVYAELPLTFKFYWNEGDYRVYTFLGPYLGVGVGGTIKLDIKAPGFGSFSANEDIKFGSSDGKIKRFDLGGAVGAGIQFSKFKMAIIYSHGFVDINNDNTSSIMNRTWSLTMGYRIAKN